VLLDLQARCVEQFYLLCQILDGAELVYDVGDQLLRSELSPIHRRIPVKR